MPCNAVVLIVGIGLRELSITELGSYVSEPSIIKVVVGLASADFCGRIYAVKLQARLYIIQLALFVIGDGRVVIILVISQLALVEAYQPAVYVVSIGGSASVYVIVEAVKLSVGGIRILVCCLLRSSVYSIAYLL